MIQYLYQSMLYLYRTRLKNIPFKHFDLWNDQVVNNKLSEGLRYPALFMQMKQVNSKTIGQRVNKGEIQITFHIYTQSRGSTRDKGPIMDKTIDHYNVQNTVDMAFNGVSWDSGVIPFNIIPTAYLYNFGSLDLINKSDPKIVGNLQYSTITFRTNFWDQSNALSKPIVQYGLSALTYTEIDGYSNAVWTMSLGEPWTGSTYPTSTGGTSWSPNYYLTAIDTMKYIHQGDTSAITYIQSLGYLTGVSNEYWTSGQTIDYVYTQTSGITTDLSLYWTSGQTIDYVHTQTSGITIDLSPYYTSAQTDANFLSANTSFISGEGANKEIAFFTGNKVISGSNMLYRDFDYTTNTEAIYSESFHPIASVGGIADFSYINDDFTAPNSGVSATRAVSEYTVKTVLEKELSKIEYSLSGLTDVTLSGLTTNDILLYSGTTNKWTNVHTKDLSTVFYTQAQTQTLVTSSINSSITYLIDYNNSNSLFVTTGTTQTISGTKTFNNLNISGQLVVTGTTQLIGDVTSVNNVIFTSNSGIGLKLNPSSPAFGWKDLLGQIAPRVGGGAAPAFTAFRGTNVRSYNFQAADIIDQMVFHIPHDYVQGSTLYLHPHWGHNGTNISGNFVINWYLQYAKGYSQSAFNSEINITQTIVTTATTHKQWYHNINEFAITTPTGSTTSLDGRLIEPDGLLIVSLITTTIPTITGGVSSLPFIFQADLHYQSNQMTTINKNFPFWS